MATGRPRTRRELELERHLVKTRTLADLFAADLLAAARREGAAGLESSQAQVAAEQLYHLTESARLLERALDAERTGGAETLARGGGR